MNSTDGITILINSVRELCQVGICFYDLHDFFHYDKYGVQNNRGHYCEFCKRVRDLPNGRASCEKSDKVDAIELAKQYKEPFFYECHMGMIELVIPLQRDDVLLGVIFIGQCRLDKDYDVKIRANAKKMSGNPDEFSDLYNSLPLLTTKDLMNVSNIITQYFDTKILNSELLSPKTSTVTGHNELETSIKQFIRLNYKSRLSLKEIADALHTNASYASRCFSEKCGMTVTDYIKKVRIDRAKILLLSTDIPVGNIALNVGFEDVNYFSRVFRELTGISPSQFREEKGM